jgi:4'-phosphopantetheinyl transferase
MPTNRHWPRQMQPPALSADDVHAWAVPLNVSQRAYDGLLATLASTERERASEFRFDDPRRRYVITRGTLRKLLGTYLHLHPTEINLTIGENEKPQLASEHSTADLHFNVSHSGDLAVLGFAVGCKLGIDVEQLRDVGHLEQIARRFFHPSEIEAVLASAASGRNLAFLRCWTSKEAIVKALGTGIVGNLAGFQVRIDDDWQGWIEHSAELPHGERSRSWLVQLTPSIAYVAALACVESKRQVRKFTFAERDA